jgi:hypothetical protein
LVVAWVVLACGDKKSETASASADKSEQREAKMDARHADDASPSMAPAPGGAEMEDAKKGKDEGGGGSGGKTATTWKRSVAVANTSQLFIGDTETLPIKGMQLRSQIDGFRARVLIDFFFFNPNPQQYEGTFKLRLPDGASPLFFAFGESVQMTPKAAFDTPTYDDAKESRKVAYEPEAITQQREAKWIKPKIARMVPKEQAAFAYTDTVRRAVDPALMEWAGTGIFNARVFPIAPNKLHRIVVAYDMDLTAIGDDLELQIPIPEGLPSSAIDLNIAVPKGRNVTVVPEGTTETVGEREFHRIENTGGKTLSVRLEGAANAMLVGDDPKVGPFFAAAVTPELPKAPSTGGARKAVLLVDTSMSSNPDGFVIWLQLLRALLDNNRKSIDGFAVMFFDTDATWWRTEMADNTAANVDAVIAHANTLVLEGATDLGAALGEASKPAWLTDGSAFDLFVLSDGGVTWGESDRHVISARLGGTKAGALFAYRTGLAGSDTAMLEHLARERGGAVFSVSGETEVAAASVAHNTRPWTLESVELGGTTDVLVAGRPRALFAGQRLIVSGRGAPAKGAVLKLKLSQDGRAAEVNAPVAVQIDSDLTARTYGQHAVMQLEDFALATKSVATAYARHFRVTGATTSLLMLESDDDYARYGIVPENDANAVKEREVGPLLTRALEQLAAQLGDPKAAFLARLAELEHTPGVEVKIPAALLEMLRGLPSSAFAVPSDPLHPKNHVAEGIPTDVLGQLATQKPEYDTLVAEAERRLAAYGPDDALEALSSLVEASPGDGVLARDVGFSAMQWGKDAQAYYLFDRVAKARPWEPQTYRAMALSAAASGKGELALALFEVALAGKWDARFGEFRQILLQDYLRFLSGTATGKMDALVAGYARTRLADVRKDVGITEADIVITITWNTDNTDVDLHVLEPGGEECYYSNPRTSSGGRITRDVTQGYGPEMYVLEKAPTGKYQIRAKYFASDSNRASARTKVYATVTRDFGRKTEKVEEKVVTLERGKDMHDLVTLEL